MRWEYKTIYFSKNTFFSGKPDMEVLQEQLNELGKEGWELVNAAPHFVLGRGKGLVLILKKQH